MSSQVRVVKKPKADASRIAPNGDAKNEQQRNREIVGVIKSWIQEFRLGNASRSQAALALLNK